MFFWWLFRIAVYSSQVKSGEVFLFTKGKRFTEFERTIVNKWHYDINKERQSSIVPLQIHHSNCCGNKRTAWSFQCFKTPTWGLQFKHGFTKKWYKIKTFSFTDIRDNSVDVSCSTSCFNRNLSIYKVRCLSMHAVFKTQRQKKQYSMSYSACVERLLLHNVFVHAPQLSFCWLVERFISCSPGGFQKRLNIQSCVMKAWQMHLSWMIIRIRLALFRGKSHYIIAISVAAVHAVYGIILFIGMY